MFSPGFGENQRTSIDRTMAERFCAANQIAPEDFEQAVLLRALYPWACRFYFLLSLNRRYFAADREFVNAVGRIRRMKEFGAEALDFAYNPLNRGFFRRVLRLRVSTQRLADTAREVFR